MGFRGGDFEFSLRAINVGIIHVLCFPPSGQSIDDSKSARSLWDCFRKYDLCHSDDGLLYA